MTRSLLSVFAILLLLANSGCTVLDNAKALLGMGRDLRPTTAEGLVNEAMDDFAFGRYEKAFKKFEEIRDRYPFSEFSLLAELKMADCKYYLQDYEEAADLYQAFEDDHPTNEAIPYVMFQIGMAHFRTIDTIDRDTTGATEAIEAFSRLLRAYPDSPYTEEAQARITAARNFLAGHELYVANFYLKREEYKQAAGRLQYILDNYSDTVVAEQSRELLAAVQSDNPPRRTWRDWLPDLSLPSWKSIKEGLIFSPAGGATGAP